MGGGLTWDLFAFDLVFSYKAAFATRPLHPLPYDLIMLYFVSPRRVRKSEGLKLARAYSTLFGEVSALDGRNVDHAIIELAKLLAERQDFNIQKTIKLSEKQEKKSCC